MAEEFYNFDEALDQLNLKEEELKRLVSEGEIRAFREGDTMKLRRNDVESLKNELMGGDVVDLGASGEELVFEDDLDLEDAGMQTEEIAEMDTLVESTSFDVAVEDVGSPDETMEVDVEMDDDDLDDDFGSEPAPIRRAGGAQEEEAHEGMGIRLLAIVTSVILLLAVPVVVSLSTGNTSPIAQKIVDTFGSR